uniref:Uncharacterized protein n=1 Tax=Rhizophora mucronata TaxID=61149 RepID=A0A2P2L0Q8_RHIMU
MILQAFLLYVIVLPLFYLSFQGIVLCFHIKISYKFKSCFLIKGCP